MAPPPPTRVLAARLGAAAAAAAPSRTSTTLRIPARRFHSHDHPPTEGPFGPVELAMLAAAYRHVPEHGFSPSALRLGARDAGLLDISSSVLPDASFSLIRYHLVTQRQGLASQGQALSDGPPARPVADKVAALTWARLMANKDIIHHWQHALAVMAQPSYLPASLKELALLSDEICFLAGDSAVDPSWYSKRASLSVVYSTAELFMTNDKSPDFAETSTFLDRRLAEVKTAGRVVDSLGQWAGFTMNAGINVLRSKGIRI